MTELPDSPVDDDPVTELPDSPVDDDPVTELSDSPVTEEVTFGFLRTTSDFLKTERIICYYPHYYPQLFQGDRRCLLRLDIHTKNYFDEMTEEEFNSLIRE